MVDEPRAQHSLVGFLLRFSSSYSHLPAPAPSIFWLRALTLPLLALTESSTLRPLILLSSTFLSSGPPPAFVRGMAVISHTSHHLQLDLSAADAAHGILIDSEHERSLQVVQEGNSSCPDCLDAVIDCAATADLHMERLHSNIKRCSCCLKGCDQAYATCEALIAHHTNCSSLVPSDDCLFTSSTRELRACDQCDRYLKGVSQRVHDVHGPKLECLLCCHLACTDPLLKKHLDKQHDVVGLTRKQVLVDKVLTEVARSSRRAPSVHLNQAGMRLPPYNIDSRRAAGYSGQEATIPALIEDGDLDPISRDASTEMYSKSTNDSPEPSAASIGVLPDLQDNNGYNERPIIRPSIHNLVTPYNVDPLDILRRRTAPSPILSSPYIGHLCPDDEVHGSPDMPCASACIPSPLACREVEHLKSLHDNSMAFLSHSNSNERSSSPFSNIPLERQRVAQCNGEHGSFVPAIVLHEGDPSEEDVSATAASQPQFNYGGPTESQWSLSTPYFITERPIGVSSRR